MLPADDQSIVASGHSLVPRCTEASVDVDK